MGGFWANGWNITKFFYLYPFFHELTYRSDATTDFHAWLLKRRGLAQGCAFWGFRQHYSPFQGWNPPKTTIFGAWIGVFKPHWQNIVIETTASISTKFCTTIETIKWSSWVVPIGAQQIQDGGRPPFRRKPLNRYISGILCNRMIDLVQWRILASYSGSTVKILNFWKFKMAAAAILKITKIAISPQRFDRSLRNLVADAKWVS